MAATGKCLINARDLGLEIRRWSNLPKVKKTFKNPYEAAFRMVETEFLMNIEEMTLRDVDITKGQVEAFKLRLRQLNEGIDRGKLGGIWATTMWQTSHYGKRDPVIGSVLRDSQRTEFYYKANLTNDKTLMHGVMKDIESEAIDRDLIKRPGFSTRKAQKELQKMDERLREEIVRWQNGEEPNTAKISEIQGKIDRMISENYLQVYEDLRHIVENDLGRIEKNVFKNMSESDKQKVRDGKMNIKLTSLDLATARTKDGNQVSRHMFNALRGYKTLMDNLYGQLRNGVDAKIDGIITRMQANQGEIDVARLETIREKLRGKLMPKYEGNGFFPHYTRDLSVDFMQQLMPHLDKMQESANPYIKTKGKQETISEVIDNIDSFISGHTKKRSGDYDYSKNFISSVQNYMQDVHRFNHTAFMDKHMLNGLTSVEQIYKMDGNAKGYGESIVNYLKDMHYAANGSMEMSPRTRALMRTLLGFEFISKLGYNPRGAARNLMQRLLDFVEMGQGSKRKSQEIINRIGAISEESIDAELKKHGLLFEEGAPQLIEAEVGAEAAFKKRVEYDDATDKFKFVKKSRLEKIADKVGWAANKASILHRAAENSNRKRTFKIAFAQMYDWLDGPKYREVLRKKNPKISDAKVNAAIKSRASRYAINMTVLNHFDYAEYAKSPFMRTKVGRFLGQFQHYSFEFYERNARILREAKGDVKSGYILPGQSAQGLAKAYRMALAYFVAPAIAASLTGVTYNNLIEHDTADRIKQLAVALTGDEDEIREAFYGKGPIVSTIGGPLLSDLIDIGVMLDFINLDEGGLAAKITGMEKYDPSTQSTKATQILRLLNTSLGRATERHIPLIFGDKPGMGLGVALQQEFGLYPTAEKRKQQKVYKKARAKILPKDIEKALQALERRQ